MNFVGVTHRGPPPNLRLPVAYLQKSPYRDAEDRMRHLHIADRLAEEIDKPRDEILPIYENLLRRLKTKAAIHDYLPILVAKKVRLVFRSRR